MDVSVARCCGLDVHKRLIVACCIVPGPDGQPRTLVRRFGTMPADVLALIDWLLSLEITPVAMERTGVYWQTVYNLLEGSFTLVVANAQHSKQVPGRKTDGKDAEWLATWLRHGLLRASFIPERDQRELRALTR